MCVVIFFRNNNRLNAKRHFNQIFQSFDQIIFVFSFDKNQMFQKNRYEFETTNVNIIENFAILEKIMKNRINIEKSQHVNILKNRSNVKIVFLQMNQMKIKINFFE